MSDDEVDLEWVAAMVGHLVLGSVDGDGNAVADLFEEIVQRYQGHGVYLVCCGLAEAIQRMAKLERPAPGAEGMFGFVIQDVRDGSIVAPESVSSDAQDVVVATRFLMAHVNNDSAQKHALFDAPTSPEQAMQLPVGLCRLVAIHGQARRAEKDDPDDRR